MVLQDTVILFTSIIYPPLNLSELQTEPRIKWDFQVWKPVSQ